MQKDKDGNDTVTATSTKCPQFGVAGGTPVTILFNEVDNPDHGATIASHPQRMHIRNKRIRGRRAW